MSGDTVHVYSKTAGGEPLACLEEHDDAHFRYLEHQHGGPGSMQHTTHKRFDVPHLVIGQREVSDGAGGTRLVAEKAAHLASFVVHHSTGKIHTAGQRQGGTLTPGATPYVDRDAIKEMVKDALKEVLAEMRQKGA